MARTEKDGVIQASAANATCEHCNSHSGVYWDALGEVDAGPLPADAIGIISGKAHE